METSTSSARSKGSQANDDVVSYFASLSLGKNPASSGLAVLSSSPSDACSSQTPLVKEECKGFDVVNGGSKTGFWATTSSNWASRDLYPEEGELAPGNPFPGKQSSMAPLCYNDMNFVLDDSYGSLIRARAAANYFHPDLLMRLSPIQCNRNSDIVYPSSGSYVMGSHVMNSCTNISPLHENSPRIDFFSMATNPESSEQLRRVLEKGYSWCTKETLKGVLPYIFQLMTDPHGHCVFQMLVDKCEACELHEIVLKVQLESELFIAAAFSKTGSYSIQRLIRRLKRTGMEFHITEILSGRAYQLMTHKIASHVVRQCFKLLGEKPNQVLHECLLACFLPLATDPVGCLTVNDCIDNITGSRRVDLLNLVCYYASHLSNDPSGNFVVQHVLGLQNFPLTARIICCLKGQYVQLSLKKSGSHVVEKCLESSTLGLSLVVAEIFDNDNTLFQLARDQFGNYVIQTALRVAKDNASHVYKALVTALKPHYPNLLHKASGKFVINVIKGDLESHRDKTDP